MPYASKAQARAIMANTNPTSPKHRHARAEAKKALRKRSIPGLSSVAKMKGVLVLAAAGILAAGAALAEPSIGMLSLPSACTTSGTEIADELQSEHGESIIWRGVTHSGDLMTIFQSPTGAWSAMMQRPDGMTCMFMHGEDGEAHASPAKGSI